MKVIMIIVGVLIIMASISSFLRLAGTEHGAGLLGVFVGCLGVALLGYILIKNGIKKSSNEG